MELRTIMRCHFTPIRIKKNKITSVGKDAEETDPSYIAGRMRSVATMENSLAVHLKVKHKVIMTQ